MRLHSACSCSHPIMLQQQDSVGYLALLTIRLAYNQMWPDLPEQTQLYTVHLYSSSKTVRIQRLT